MDPKMEDAKGRAKEAAGALTGDDELKDEGKSEQASAKAHEAVENVADKAKEAVGKASKAAEDAIESVKDKFSK